MDDAQFWKMIDESRKKSRGILEDQLDRLEASVKQLTPDEIVEFDQVYSKYMSQAYTWDLWGAAYVIGGGCSDDGFEYFRGWLISKGRTEYEKALKDPEALVSILHEDDGDGQFEGFGYVAMKAWEEKTEKPADEMPGRTIQQPSEPTGEKWSEDSEELKERYPKLSEKFGF